MTELTAKQERFCQEYLIDLNATQAAIRAGYSAKTAAEQSSRLLSNVKVSYRVATLQKAASKRTDIDVDYVVNGLRREAEDMEAGSGSSRVSALEKLGKHLGMFTDRLEHSGAVEIKRIERVILQDK